MSVAVIQARFSSQRLPGKVLAPLGESTVLGWTIRAAFAAGEVEAVVVATSTQPEDDAVAAAARDHGAHVVRGPLDDVLARYVIAARQFPASSYVRLTADCPLLDPKIIDLCSGLMRVDPGLDLISNAIVRAHPRGLDVEVIGSSALVRVDKAATGHHRLHVTTWMTDHPDEFRIVGVVGPLDAGDLRVTVDTPEDLEVVRVIVRELGEGPFKAANLTAWLRANPATVARNSHVEQKRDEEG